MTVLRMLAVLLAFGGVAAAAEAPSLPQAEVDRLLAQSELIGVPYTVEPMGMDYGRPRWRITIKHKPTTRAGLCFQLRSTLGVWIDDGGAYAVYARQPTLAVSPFACRPGLRFVDIKNTLDTETTAPILARMFAYAERHGAKRARLHSIERGYYDTSMRVCFARAASRADACFFADERGVRRVRPTWPQDEMPIVIID